MTQTKERKQEIAYGEHDLDDCTHVAEPNTFKPSPTELRKYRLIQGEVAGTYEGCANPIFQIHGEEFYYAQGVEELIAKLKQELLNTKAELESAKNHWETWQELSNINQEEATKLKQELAEKDKQIKKLVEYNHKISRVNNADGYIPKAKVQEVITKAHQEAHMCNASAEIHDWINWFEKELLTAGEKDIKKIPVKHLCMDCWHKGQIQKDCPKCKGTGKGDKL